MSKTTPDHDRDRNRERDSEATFGDYGGQYVPEALMPALQELEDAYERYVLNNEDGFMDEFRERMRDFGGRPTPLQRADRLSERYDREIYLKREDLVHGGAHKLNNALGQVLLAKYMGKERIIAETRRILMTTNWRESSTKTHMNHQRESHWSTAVWK